MNVLLADDDSKIHLIVKMWLSRQGHDTTSAHNGQEALAALEAGDFDMLISDVNMPLMNGVDLVKSALQLGQGPEHIILMTSRCDTQTLAQEINSSRVHVFSKPFSPPQLAQLVEQLASAQV